VLFGIMALVVDLAIVQVTFGRMETAARSGALEGLRHRDGPFDERVEARDMVRLVFDDDLDLSSDFVGVGAGPVVDIGPSDSDLGAFQRIEAIGVYKPYLELNDGSEAPLNEEHGDMLSGYYDAAQSHYEGGAGNPYLRDDLLKYDGSGPAPDAFLVRLRRTADLYGLDNIPGVSSTGDSIPFLFGRGSMIFKATGSSYDPRRDGISFSARAIAQQQPALSVGPASAAAGGIPGVARVALALEFWNSLTPGAPVFVTVSPTGALTQSPPAGSPRDGQVIGVTVLAAHATAAASAIDVHTSDAFPDPPFQVDVDSERMVVVGVSGDTWTVERDSLLTAPHSEGAPVRIRKVAAIGDEILPAVVGNPHNRLNDHFLPTTGELYMPIFAEIPGVGERIIGFGRADLEDPTGLGPPYALPVNMKLTKLGSLVGEENVSAGLVRAVDTGLSDADILAVFAERWQIDEPLTAPALVRAYGG